MSISTDHLSAFLLVHETGSFTEAALKAGVTQSALSQKIRRLEDRLQTVLFVRQTWGPQLTAAGEELLVFARQQLGHEQEFLKSFELGQTELAGVIRIAGFSSVMRSAVIPALAPFIRQHSHTQVIFSQHEMKELPALLKTNGADLIVLDYEPAVSGVEFEVMGREKYVVIESAKFKTPPDLYLDHGPDDNATDSFFRAQGKKSGVFRRGFMGDVYGILDGVALGLGRAVMSEHLVDGDKRFSRVSGFKAYDRPLVLCWNAQSWYSRLQNETRAVMLREVSKII